MIETASSTIFLWMTKSTMVTDLGPYVGVVLLASVKYFFGVITALLKGFGLAEVIVTAGGGGFGGAIVYTYFGTGLRNWFERTFRFKRRQRSFSQRKRIVKIWRRYGLLGVCLLIPILSPQVSIGVAIAFREKPRRILLYVAGSIMFWILVFYFLKETVLTILGYGV